MGRTETGVQRVDGYVFFRVNQNVAFDRTTGNRTHYPLKGITGLCSLKHVARKQGSMRRSP